MYLSSGVNGIMETRRTKQRKSRIIDFDSLSLVFVFGKKIVIFPLYVMMIGGVKVQVLH